MNLTAQTASALRALAAEAPIDLFVSGTCMSPYLRSGDRIRVTPAPFYWPGDVVAFHRDDDRLLVHRVLGYTLGRDGVRLLAKGDGLSREDEPVPLERVIGRVLDSPRHRPSLTFSRERWRSLAAYLRVLVRRSLAPWRSATAS